MLFTQRLPLSSYIHKNTRCHHAYLLANRALVFGKHGWERKAWNIFTISLPISISSCVPIYCLPQDRKFCTPVGVLNCLNTSVLHRFEPGWSRDCSVGFKLGKTWVQIAVELCSDFGAVSVTFLTELLWEWGGGRCMLPSLSSLEEWWYIYTILPSRSSNPPLLSWHQ